MNINKNIISFVLFSSLLTACSGGGGGGSSNADTPNDSNTLKTQPVAAAPVAQAPAEEMAVAAAPVAQTPAEEMAVAAAPVAQAPAGEMAVAAAPVVQEPVADAPASDASVAVVPVIQIPVVEEPIAAAAMAQIPEGQETASVMPLGVAAQTQNVEGSVIASMPAAHEKIDQENAVAGVLPAASAEVQGSVAEALPVVQPQADEMPVVVDIKPVDMEPVVTGSLQSFMTNYVEVSGANEIKIKRNTTFGLDPNSQFHVTLSGSDLVVEADEFKTDDPRDNRMLLDHNLHALHDVDGTLLGYYGRVSTVTHFEEAMDVADVDKVTDTYVYSMDTAKRRVPDIAADYKGKVYYNKHDVIRDADVSLHYEDRKVSGSIDGTVEGLNGNLHYIINDNGVVDDNGSFSATMRHEYERKGSMSGIINGGFYGQGGAIAVGNVGLDIDPSTGLPRDVGVFGAERVTLESGK